MSPSPTPFLCAHNAPTHPKTKLSAAIRGLANGKLHHLAFRLKLREGATSQSFPKGDSVIVLPGTPRDGVALPEAVERAAAMGALEGQQGQPAGACVSMCVCECACV
jgi:hypothetical protein